MISTFFFIWIMYFTYQILHEQSTIRIDFYLNNLNPVFWVSFILSLHLNFLQIIFHKYNKFIQ